jgi:hypothetical protein
MEGEITTPRYTPFSHPYVRHRWRGCAAQSRLRWKDPSSGPWTNAIDENRSVVWDVGNRPEHWFWLGYTPKGIAMPGE